MTSRELVGAVATRCTPAICALAIAPIFTPTSLLSRAASAYRLVLLLAPPFLPTRTRARSRGIIVGRNFSRMDVGYRWISAKRGRIQSWLIIILDTIRLTGSN